MPAGYASLPNHNADEDELEAAFEASDDEDVEDPADVAMVPMADMLNARYGCNNVSFNDYSSLLRILISFFRPGSSTSQQN